MNDEIEVTSPKLKEKTLLGNSLMTQSREELVSPPLSVAGDDLPT